MCNLKLEFYHGGHGGIVASQMAGALPGVPGTYRVNKLVRCDNHSMHLMRAIFLKLTPGAPK